MLTKNNLIGLMPASDGKNTINFPVVVNKKIITTLHKNTDKAALITKDIAPLFKGNTIEETCRNIWNFLKTEITYKKDLENQDIKLPNRFLKEGTGDCKSYSLFAGSILKNLNIPFAYRYTSYSEDPTPQHVYIVALKGKKNSQGLSEVIITDGVWKSFNNQKKYTYKKDFMPVRTLSGLEDEIGKIQLGKKIKQAAAKIQDKAKDTAVVKKAAQIQDKAKDTAVIKKAAQIQNKAKDTAVVKQAAQIQEKAKQAKAQIQAKAKQDIKQGSKKIVKLVRSGAAELKNIPKAAKVVLGAPERRAFRTLVALNFHNYANKLNANKDKTFAMWKKLGGIREELEKSINAGLKRKSILGIGCLNCRLKGQTIGDPATIAAALAAATPVILAFSAILKEAFSTIKAGKEAFSKQKTADENGSQDAILKLDTNQEGGPVEASPQLGPNFTDTTKQPDTNVYDSGRQVFNPFTGDQIYRNQESAPAPETKTAPAPEPEPETKKESSAAPLIIAAVAAKLLFF